MAIPFSRSTRSINHDRYLSNMIGIVSILLLLILWIIWFFTGQLSIFASTVDYQVREDGMILGNFSAANLPKIKPGQQAELILPFHNGIRTEPIKAEVMNIPGSIGEPVEIALFGQVLSVDDEKGQLKIHLGFTTPAKLIWNSLQK